MVSTVKGREEVRRHVRGKGGQVQGVVRPVRSCVWRLAASRVSPVAHRRIRGPAIGVSFSPLAHRPTNPTSADPSLVDVSADPAVIGDRPTRLIVGAARACRTAGWETADSEGPTQQQPQRCTPEEKRCPRQKVGHRFLDAPCVQGRESEHPRKRPEHGASQSARAATHDRQDQVQPDRHHFPLRPPNDQTQRPAHGTNRNDAHYRHSRGRSTLAAGSGCYLSPDGITPPRLFFSVGRGPADLVSPFRQGVTFRCGRRAAARWPDVPGECG